MKREQFKVTPAVTKLVKQLYDFDNTNGKLVSSSPSIKAFQFDKHSSVYAFNTLGEITEVSLSKNER